MSHPDEGRLRALLDDEVPTEAADQIRAHIVSCSACDERLRRAEETQALATALLNAIDVPAPQERARARFAERSGGERSPTRAPARAPARAPGRAWFRRADLAKAALLLLGFSGAVAAAVHPASPLRRWLTGGPRTVETAAPATDTGPTAPAAPREVGVRVALVPVGVRISLTGVPAGTELDVLWVAEGTAAVYATEGTTFVTSTADGRIQAAVAGGPIRIELPLGATRASLVVDGRVYLEKTGERIDYPGPPALVEGARVSFQVR